MAVKIADTLKTLSNTFPVAECIDIDVNINGTTKRLQKAIDDGEIGGNVNSLIDDANVSNKTTYSSDKITKEIETLKSIQNLDYEGKDITCENTLISRTYDMIIKGQTYQNLFDFFRGGAGCTIDDFINVIGTEDGVWALCDIRLKPQLSSNKIYTVIYNCIDKSGNFEFTGFDSKGNWKLGITIEKTGINKFLISNKDVSFIRIQTNKNNAHIKIDKNIIILEGDWTNKEAPESITGIESAGEKENKISILSNNNKLVNDIDYRQDKKEVLLPIKGGLKSLPNGICDTIEQRADGIYLVQKIDKYDIKEDDIIKTDSPPNQQNTIAFSINVNAKNIKTSGNNICNNFNRFTSGDLYWNSDNEGILNSSNSQFKFRILKSKLSTQDIAGIKAWLKANLTTVCYEINTPVETKLDINDLDLEVYEGTTCITTDNAIQPTLSFKVPSNIGGLIQSNVRNINELYNIIENVEISNVEQMKLNDTIFPLSNNETVQLEVTKNFEGDVTYETSNSAVATVSTSGLITKKANGTATITANCKDKSVSCEVVDLITKNSNTLPLLNIPYLHSRGITGKGVKVALIESLIGNNEEFEIDGWYDTVGKKLYRTKPSASDIDGIVDSANHTYHMSTLIHGKTRGVAPDCEFYHILPVYDSNNPEKYDDEKYYRTICDGIEWAIEFGIKVICICQSLNGGYTQFREVFKKAYDAGVTICMPMCNCNIAMLDEYSYYNGFVSNAYCLMIGACEKNGTRNPTTCKGEAMMFNNYGYSGLQCWNPSAKYNATTNRTSAATALTTGCVALLLQQDPTLTPRQIYHIFKDNAILHSSSTPGVKSIDYGWGRINVPVLSNIIYKSDAECKALDAQIPIENINAVLVKGRYDGDNGFYKNINVNSTHELSCFVIPVEQDRYTYEFIPLNDNARLVQANLNKYGVKGVKPGIFRMLIRLKELGISKEVSFNVK